MRRRRRRAHGCTRHRARRARSRRARPAPRRTPRSGCGLPPRAPAPSASARFAAWRQKYNRSMKSLWDDAEAARFGGPLGPRIYTSRLLGRDKSLVLHGGGNTSVKLRERNLFGEDEDRKSTRLNSSHTVISYAVFCLKKKKERR